MFATLAVGGATAAALGWRAGLLLGVVLGVATVLALGLRRLPDPPVRRPAQEPPLPAACWVYFVALSLGVALEYAVLLWSPAFLEQAAGMSKASAATGAAAFAAMLTGRAIGSRLVRAVPPATLYATALLAVLPGFALYWSASPPAASVVGLFVIGLGVALLYPLSLSFAVGAAGPSGEAAGARSSLAAGLAILIAPVTLGALADAANLGTALLAVPALACAVGAAFALARALERRAVYAMRSVLP
jgi:predicted MFS family arabinose efflux permease